MKRLIIIVEGSSEEEFVNKTLASLNKCPRFRKWVGELIKKVS